MHQTVDVDYSSLSDVLKNPIRRRIILALSGGNCVSYVELMNLVEVTNTGKFNYHLKTLGDLIQKDQSGKYCLTEKRQLAVQFLQRFPEKQSETKSLRMADAALIGFAGVVVTASSPTFLIGGLMGVLGFAVQPFPMLIAFSVLNSLCGLVVPGAMMWWLSVRRVHSHDMYDLLKPPFVAFILSLILLLVMYFVSVDVRVTLSAPPVPIGQYGVRYSETGTTIAANLMRGLVLSFLGVAIAEAVSRLKRKWSSK